MDWIIVLITFCAVTIEASPDFCETWLLYCSSLEVLPEVPHQLYKMMLLELLGEEKTLRGLLRFFPFP